MFNLFTTDPRVRSGDHITPIFHQVADFLKKEAARCVVHHRSVGNRVHNEHFLVRLLEQLGSPSNNDIRSWYYTAEDMISIIDQPYGIISETNGIARVHRGIFLTGHAAEIFFDFRTTVDLDTLEEDILEIPAVKVFSHPYSGISYSPLTGRQPIISEALSDYAVIGLDIALLYTQYHIWLKLRNDSKSNKTIHNFIADYPLLNAVGSYNEQAVWNRILCIATGIEPANGVIRQMWFNSAYREQIDDAIRKQIAFIKSQQLTFPEVLKALPSIYHRNQLESLMLPEVMMNRQMRWVMLTARLQAFKLLASRDLKTGAGNDNQYYNEWREGLLRLSSDRAANFPSSPDIEDSIRELSARLQGL